MRGVRFYADPYGTAEYDGDKPPNKLTRLDYRNLAAADRKINCIALFTGPEHRVGINGQEALVATFAHQDSDVTLGTISTAYLLNCRHIGEETARKLHPRLAWRLDQQG